MLYTNSGGVHGVTDDVSHAVNAARLFIGLYKKAQGEYGFKGITQLVYTNSQGEYR